MNADTNLEDVELRKDFNCIAFPKEEYTARRDQLRVAMASRGIDVAVITSIENASYLTGYGASALVIRSNGEAIWVLRLTELSNVRGLADKLWVTEGVGVADGEDFSKILNKALVDLAGEGAMIGVELNEIPKSLRGFAKLPPNVQNISGLVEAMRRVKSPGEVDLLRRAGWIAAQSCRDGFESLKEGMTDTQLAEVVTSSLLRNGSDRPKKMPNVCAGTRSARAHVTWCGYPMVQGDVVNIEPAAAIFDYQTPIYRIYTLGPPSDQVRRMFEACSDSLSEGYARVRPGMTSHEAARIFESVIEKAGFGSNMVTRPAYSIGINWGEDSVMAIKRHDESVLEEGMCFHVVPVLYMDGVGCVAASQSSVLMKNGFEPLGGDEVVLRSK